jgi:S-DNA-T family DNA segregation ATPase FtsK/SpoIIIE
MKIYLYLKNRVLNFSLPQEISGSFSFDEDPQEESKLINIEARNNKWILYSTSDVTLVENNSIIGSKVIDTNSFYTIRRDEQDYLIYVSNLLENNIETYQFNQEINLTIGNGTDCNVRYNCEFLKGMAARIYYENGALLLKTFNNNIIYINNIALEQDEYIIKVGDQINIYALKFIFSPNLLLVNNPGGKLNLIVEQITKLQRYQIATDAPKNIEIKDVNLYSEEDYYSKSPRIRRIIETKEIKLSPPPRNDDNQELPLILTIGPMLTMGMMSIVTLANTVSKICLKETTVSEQWPSLLTSGAMVVSMLLWPNLTRIYNKKMKERKRKEIISKYTEYLDEKKKELLEESKLQKTILLENLITTEECLKIIETQGLDFWDKRIDQDDFLNVRIGFGNELLDAKIDYPEEGFTIEEDELRKKADEMVAEFKYINNVPVGYSFSENRVTAIMGASYKSHSFINNIILQLLTFYSYEDLKLVVFTNELKEYNWNYVKYLNHNFNNERNFRFYSSTVESSKKLAEYLNVEVNNRQNIKEDYHKPHYVVLIDDYDRVKRFDFFKTITESDDNLGFSIILVEEKMSRLPSKCNNFISLGSDGKGRILKNSYEKQEQIIFCDEIIYGLNMMNVAKVISNIPIEFENGIKRLPDSISFMEMERVGKVEQLNVLNRWNINDSTTSLKAEVGVDEQGDLMYLDLHEKFHGPHGLIAGTTGSGKSEFIITYILSMCINYSPDDVSFILIDYKGGGLALAFENKTTGVSLPHLAGTITNLDKAEMDRTLVSIDSEVKRRQQMFNTARDALGESTIDIYKYQRFYKEGKLNVPIPHLFIICDEFAELKSQQPEFMDNLISVARIGRSLGIHLILATQKPSGVVNDQIWSNSKFKVCLKVQDESDSKEMLKKPDAAYLKQAGRFYLQVGYDEYYALGQSGWCGAKYYPSDKIVKQVDKSINFINDCGIFIKSIQASSGVKIEAQGEQLANVMKSIIEVSNKVNKKAKKLWLENIPPIILIDNIEKKYNITINPYDVEAIIGEYDAPEKQEQGIVKYNYLRDGNTIIYGNDGSERELLLSTIIYSTVKNHRVDEINYYIIDYGSESLRRYLSLPHVGGIVFSGEEEKFHNLFKMIKEELQTRKKLFADYGGEYLNYIKNSNSPLPLKVIVFNNYDSIYESNPNLYDDLPELVRDSERYGVIFIFTCNATNSINSKVSSNCSNNYAFKLKDVSDYTSIFGIRCKTMPRDTEGRGLLNNDGLHEFQTANIVEDDDKLNDYLIAFMNNQKQLNQTKAKRIPVLPDIVRIDDIRGEISNIKSVPIGISKSTLDVIEVDYSANMGNIVTSNKLVNTKNFIISLLVVLRNISNLNLFVIDPLKLLELNTSYFPNYYIDNLDTVVDKLIEYIKSLKENNQNLEGIILIYGLNKFISKVNDSKKITELTKIIKEYEKISLIAVDDSSKIKAYAYESWFTSIFSVNDGVWVGRGVSDQNLLHLSTINKEMTKDIKNNMGYYVSEGSSTLCKFIDFITKEDDDNGK